MVCMFIKHYLFKIVMLQKIRKIGRKLHLGGYFTEIKTVIFSKT